MSYKTNQLYKTTVNNLVVSGCSFTHNGHKTPIAWANLFATWADINLTNLAIPGAGNTHISNSIMLYLEKNKPDPSNTLVIAQWSGSERIDWITDKKSSQFGNNYPFEYGYDSKNELVLGGAWWANKSYKNAELALVKYSKYQSDSSLALHSWLAIQNLTNYLKQNKYNYMYTAMADRNAVVGGNTWIQFDDELSQIGLKLDTSQWIRPHLYEYSKEHDYLDTDKFHPTRIGAETWVTDVLVPYLKDKGIIYELRLQ